LIRAYYPDGSTAGKSFSCPFANEPALAYNGKYYIVAEPKAYTKIYLLDEEGNEIAIYKTKIKVPPKQFTWAEDHYNNNLWYIDIYGIINQLTFAGDSALVSLTFEGPGDNQTAIAHDGTDLWQGENIGPLYLIDDGIDEISWFTTEPEQGTVASEASVEIMLNANLTELPQTDTSTVFTIQSNDPLNNSIYVPFNFTYTTIDLGADTSFCSERNIWLDAGVGYKAYTWSDGTDEQTLLVDSTAYGLGTFAVWAEALDYADGTYRDTIMITFEDCTGIDEFTADDVISIIPNPNEGVFDIIAEGFSAQVTLQIMDLNGRIVYSTLLEPDKGRISKRMNLTGYLKGLYLVKLMNENKAYTHKIVIE
jgi:hypothetical protein